MLLRVAAPALLIAPAAIALLASAMIICSLGRAMNHPAAAEKRRADAFTSVSASATTKRRIAAAVRAQAERLQSEFDRIVAQPCAA